MQKTAYEMRISDWSSDVCSSDLWGCGGRTGEQERRGGHHVYACSSGRGATRLQHALLAACTRRCSGYHRCKAGPSAREDQRAPRWFGQAGIISRPSGADRADEDNWEGLAHLFYVRKSRTYLVSCKLLIVTGLKIVQIVRHGRTEATTAEPASHQPDPRADGRFQIAAGARHLQDVDP